MKPYEITLTPGQYYHIYNRGVNGTDLFYETRNYAYFLEKYAYHTSEVLDTLAYCLLKNHFHLLVRVKHWDVSLFNHPTPEKDGLHHSSRLASKRLSNFFNCYTKSINQATGRTGALIESPFKRIPVQDDAYLWQLIDYIHRNPQKHGFIDDYRQYPYSSYRLYKTQISLFADALPLYPLSMPVTFP